MKTADEFKIYRELADKCRNCDPFKNPQEAVSLLNLLAGFLDKLIAQKEAERETSRRSDTENLTAAINDLTGIISVLAERVGSAAPKAKSTASKKPEKINAEEYQHILNAYNDNCGSLPKVAKLTEKRRRAIRLCVEQGFSNDDFCAAFKKAASTPFLTGDNDRKWRANFDFIVKPDNLQRIIEGAYGLGQETSHSYNLDLIFEHAMNTTPKFD